MIEKFTFDDVLINPSWTHINSRMDVDISSNFSRNVKLRIPISSANMRTVTDSNMCKAMSDEGGIGILHRGFGPIHDHFLEITKIKNENFGISIGIIGWKQLLDELVLHKVKKEFDDSVHYDYFFPKVVVLDVANAANDKVYEEVKKIIQYKNRLKEHTELNFDIVVGNIATTEAAKIYKELDIDGIKVGIGPGSCCSTRIMTGIGVPQLSAIIEIASVLKRSDITLIADGGIEKPADFCKAIAAGADCVMMGKILAYAKESPDWGPIMEQVPSYNRLPIGKGYDWQPTMDWRKEYKGESTFAINRTYEGVSHVLKSFGEPKSLKEIIKDYEGGLRSSMSYCNAMNIQHYQENTEFIKVSTNTLIENKTRG
jgi:IMP dehydrogenase